MGNPIDTAVMLDHIHRPIWITKAAPLFDNNYDKQYIFIEKQ